MKRITFICSLILSICSFGQTLCDFQLKQDSATVISPKIKEVVEIIEVKIKNNYQVQFIKQDKKNYLKIIVKDNLGFGKRGSLLLVSAKKQVYVKSLTLEPIDKNSAYFLVELNNSFYLDNFKEFGLSKIIFNETTEFGVPKSDSDQIRKAADCFYNIVKDNIWPPVKKL
ncbi:MAG: hypothetical protein V4565_08140 [Bacteroidota bacterium]